MLPIKHKGSVVEREAIERVNSAEPHMRMPLPSVYRQLVAASLFLVSPGFLGCRSYPWSPETVDSTSQSVVTRSEAAKPTRGPTASGSGQSSSKRDAEYAAQLAKGRALEKSGKLDAAREVYERLIVWAPDRYEAYHRLAVVCDRQQRYTEAEALYVQAIRLNPANPDLFNDLGYCYILQGKFEKAERALLKAVGLSPANERYRNNLGLVYGYQGRYQEALEQFRRGGSEPDAWYNLAYVQWVRQDEDLARQSLENALALNPNHLAAQQSLERISSGKTFFVESPASQQNWRSYEVSEGADFVSSTDSASPSTQEQPSISGRPSVPSPSLRLGMKNRPSTQTQLDVARSSWVSRVQQESAPSRSY